MDCERECAGLLDNREIKNAVITIDAAGCQRAIAQKIIDGKGDYVLALKGNQRKLHDAVTDYIEKHMENNFADIKARTHIETLKGHGRVDEITYDQMPVPADLVNREKWSGLKTIGVAIRQSKSGDQWSTDIRFSISSLAMGVKRFARFVRGHWYDRKLTSLVPGRDVSRRRMSSFFTPATTFSLKYPFYGHALAILRPGLRFRFPALGQTRCGCPSRSSKV